MAKVFEYQTWIADARAYWEAEIDQAVIDASHIGMGFEDQLKTEMNARMDAFAPVLSSYAADQTRRGPFIGVLLALSNYATSKFLMVTPEVSVPNIPLLPTNSATDLFAWFNEDLPPYETLFEIVFTEDPLAVPPTVEAELLNVTYDDALSATEGYLSDDLQNFDDITMQIVGAVRESAAYIVFAGADAVIVRNEGTPKEILLNDFGVSDVLDEFGWIVKGLNG